MPSVKISTQAIMLQMAAADLFGQPNYQKFDELTVSLSHPDADAGADEQHRRRERAFRDLAVLRAGDEDSRTRALLTTSYEILGGRASALVVVATHEIP